MSDQTLLTGANGFIGTQIALWLLKNTEHDILAMVRANDEESALNRLKRAWWDWGCFWPCCTPGSAMPG